LQDCRKDLTGLSKVVSPLLSAILQSCNSAIAGLNTLQTVASRPTHAVLVRIRWPEALSLKP
jgi:hypothetical protein